MASSSENKVTCPKCGSDLIIYTIDFYGEDSEHRVIEYQCVAVGCGYTFGRRLID